MHIETFKSRKFFLLCIIYTLTFWFFFSGLTISTTYFQLLFFLIFFLYSYYIHIVRIRIKNQKRKFYSYIHFPNLLFTYTYTYTDTPQYYYILRTTLHLTYYYMLQLFYSFTCLNLNIYCTHNIHIICRILYYDVV